MKAQTRVSLLVTLICSLAAAQSTQPAATQEASKFLRFTPDGNDGGKLEASIVTYRNDKGATVDLIAAVHIADAEFFHDLDKHFAQYDSLLYEMVKPKEFTPGDGPTTRSTRPPALSFVSAMQHFLKDQLKLTFQLEEIDYSQKNFVHADLDMETFQQMQSARGESMLGLLIQQMIRELSREQPRDSQPGIGDLLTALQSPDRARQLKLMLARDFAEMDDMLAGLGGPDGTVILTERNKAALKKLQERLAAGDKKIGIFYGAAHLKGMDEILTEKMNFKQIDEPQWRTAWDMTK